MTLTREPVDDDWFDEQVAAVLAEGGEIDANEYGTPISVHTCATCGKRFTLCPPCPEALFGPDCLGIECPSYDPARDAEVFFTPDDPDLIEGKATP